MSRVGLVCAVIAVAGASACTGPGPGTYLEISTADPFDHVELFFGGHFTSCANDIETSGTEAPVLRTARWTNTDVATNDHMYRRQTVPDGDVYTIESPQLGGDGSYDYTLWIPSALDPSSTTNSPEPIGTVAIVVVSVGALEDGAVPTAAGKLSHFTVGSDSADVYTVAMFEPSPTFDVEVWGPVGAPPACVRYTTGITATQAAGDSTFIVTDWDHDCDGFIDRECPAPVMVGSDALAPSYVDCDPLSYCGSGDFASGGCQTPGGGGCLVATDATANDEFVLGTCLDVPGGSDQCLDDGPPAPESCFLYDEAYCNTPDACAAKGCARPVIACATVHANADVVCMVPVDASGALCPPTGSGGGGSGSGSGSGGSAGSGSGSGNAATELSLDAVELGQACTFVDSAIVAEGKTDGVTIALATDDPCVLTLTPASGSAAVLLDTRVMLVSPDVGLDDDSTIIVDVAPVSGDCTMLAPTCMASGVPTVPAEHACIMEMPLGP